MKVSVSSVGGVSGKYSAKQSSANEGYLN